MNPTKTLYINNINERVPATHVRKEFLTICNEFGNVLSVVAHKGIKKRGQAFVVFDNLQSAVEAHDALQQYTWQGKQINVAYAFADSDINLSEQERLDRKEKKKLREKEQGFVEITGSGNSVETAETNVHKEPETPKLAHDYGEPHNVLLLKQIPENVTLDSLQDLLDDLPGFVDARMLAIKHVGFLEFDSIEAATEAIPWIESQSIGDVVYAK